MNMTLKRFFPLLLIPAAALNLHAGKIITVPNDASTIEAGLEQAQEGDKFLSAKGFTRKR